MCAVVQTLVPGVFSTCSESEKIGLLASQSFEGPQHIFDAPCPHGSSRLKRDTDAWTDCTTW
eukprot:10535039-Alexandrium_andersonii.AAC.1